jgi:hypothetical protein
MLMSTHGGVAWDSDGWLEGDEPQEGKKETRVCIGFALLYNLYTERQIGPYKYQSVAILAQDSRAKVRF